MYQNPGMLEKLGIPIIAGLIAGFIIFWVSNIILRRRENSKIGIPILDMLIKEVNSGIEIIKNKSYDSLPIKSWCGVNTIPNDVLLRIIAVSKNYNPDKPTDFKPNDILEHCKNYFGYISTNWERAVKSGIDLENFDKENYYLERAERVKKILIQCKNLLEENSKKILFPK